REMVDEVDRLAAGLQRLGLGKDDKITIHLPNSPEFLMMLYAAATIGAVVVPSNTANRPSELRHILSYSDSVALVTEPQFLPVVQEAAEGVTAIRHRILARTDAQEPGYIRFADLQQDATTPPTRAAGPEDVVEMLFTSGTTARPKGVLLTHANLLRSGERSSKSMHLNHDERCLTALPVFHVNAQSLTVLAALTVGGTCILLEEYRATRFWD